MKELWVPAEQDVIVRLHPNGDVGVTQDVLMVKRPVSGQRKTGFEHSWATTDPPSKP